MASGMAKAGRGARGIALVVVLWMLTLLAVIAASFTTTTRTETRLARNLVENAKAEALADAAVHRAIVGLLDGDPDARWAADGTLYEFAMADGTAWITIQDETGKIDLNAGSRNLIVALLDAADVPLAEADSLSDAIIDYRDTDDQRRPNGAEDDDYRDAGLPWGAKDAPFEAVEELQQVLGMTPLLYQAVAPALTVHTGQEGIDTGVAPRAALLAIPGTDAEAVESYLSARAGAPEGAGPTFAPAESLGTRSRSKFFTLRAESRLDNGAIFVREAVVTLGGDRRQVYRLLSWKRGSLIPAPPPSLVLE